VVVDVAVEDSAIVVARVNIDTGLLWWQRNDEEDSQ
jgi:hypothetical protein